MCPIVPAGASRDDANETRFGLLTHPQDNSLTKDTFDPPPGILMTSFLSTTTDIPQVWSITKAMVLTARHSPSRRSPNTETRPLPLHAHGRQE